MRTDCQESCVWMLRGRKMGAEILVQTTKAIPAVVTLHVLLMRFSVNGNNTLVAGAQ